MVAHRYGVPVVVGSSPAAPTKNVGVGRPVVVGSSPPEAGKSGRPDQSEK